MTTIRLVALVALPFMALGVFTYYASGLIT